FEALEENGLITAQTLSMEVSGNLPTRLVAVRLTEEGKKCCRALGWQVRDSVTPFVCARPPQPLAADRLRGHGIKLRDASSFGLPGWWRLSAQPPQAVQALVQALRGLPAAEVAAQGGP
ncbi:MAG: hypothetical protein N2383_16210, partial [Caldilineales bacterium]|nr:hypothetical protein [Caldilineales bacterium]